MRPVARLVRVAWLGVLLLKPRVRDLAIMALKAVDEEDVRSLLIALRAMCEPGVMDPINRNLAQGVIDAIERDQAASTSEPAPMHPELAEKLEAIWRKPIDLTADERIVLCWLAKLLPEHEIRARYEDTKLEPIISGLSQKGCIERPTWKITPAGGRALAGIGISESTPEGDRR